MGKQQRFTERNLPHFSQATVGDPDRIEAEEAAQPKPEFNAGDETSVGERQRQSKARGDLRVKGLSEVMSTTQGRAWMLHLLREKCQVQIGTHRMARVFTGNSNTFYNNALVELGNDIKAEVEGFFPDEYALMKQEGGIYRV